MTTFYLDNSATSFPKPIEVISKMHSVMSEFGVNADRGGYTLARETGAIIQKARESLSEFVGMRDSHNVILMPSATIALNTVLFGLNLKHGENVYLSPFEHNAVLRPLYRLREFAKINLIEIPVDRGTLAYDLGKLKKEFQRNRPKLVVINHGSNVCGVIAPLKEIATMAKEYGALVLVDAAQTLGSVDVDVQRDNIDFLAFAGHKDLCGPIGVGGLIVNSSIKLNPLIFGGTGIQSELNDMPQDYPERLEAGSPNVVAIAGLLAGMDFVKNNTDIKSKKKHLFASLLEELNKYPEIKLFVSPEEENRLAVVSCLAAGYTPQEFAMVLDQHFRIAVRSGMHCAPRTHEFLGTSPYGTVRFSLGAFNTNEDILAVKSALAELFY